MKYGKYVCMYVCVCVYLLENVPSLCVYVCVTRAPYLAWVLCPVLSVWAGAGSAV